MKCQDAHCLKVGAATDFYIHSASEFCQHRKKYEEFLQSAINRVAQCSKDLRSPSEKDDYIMIIKDWYNVHYGYCITRMFLLYGYCTDKFHEEAQKNYLETEDRKADFTLESSIGGNYVGHTVMCCHDGLLNQFRQLESKKVS